MGVDHRYDSDALSGYFVPRAPQLNVWVAAALFPYCFCHHWMASVGCSRNDNVAGTEALCAQDSVQTETNAICMISGNRFGCNPI